MYPEPDDKEDLFVIIGGIVLIVMIVLFFALEAKAQAVAVSEGPIFTNTVVTNGASANYDGAVKFSTGMSFNLLVTCPVQPCNGRIDVLGSNDNVNYEIIPQLTQGFSVPTNYLYNVFNMRMLYYKIIVTCLGPNDLVLNGYYATKSQI